jgi:hypothetical protein
MQFLFTQWQKSMSNIIAAIIATIAPLTWGLWILDRKRYDSRMIAISLVPVAITWWTALYLVGA